MLKKVFISAGELSGDLHASKLMSELKKQNPEIQFYGIGGELMQKAGLNSLADFKDISVVGFWEVAKKIQYFSKLLKKCKQVMQQEEIKLFIPVDYPGFNIKLAEFAKSEKINVIYYIAPQLWAWGKNRAEKLKKSVDKLLVVFPFEVDYFKSYDIDASFVGHPLLDNQNFNIEILKLQDRQNMIAFLPGSRVQELKKHIPLIKDISCEIKKRIPDMKFGLTLPKHLNMSSVIDKYGLTDWNHYHNSVDLMQKSVAGVIKAGTSNLEAALCGLPFALIYKTSFLSYFLGKKLINLPYLSIVNILHKQNIIGEYIQSDINPKIIAEHILRLINSPEEYNLIQNKLIEIRELIGNHGASKKASDIISNYL